ncbi:MAG: aminotransferase class I/II-fold pyridoxal phosphate-dependent enzyme [Pseudomonadota bacterium]
MNHDWVSNDLPEGHAGKAYDQCTSPDYLDRTRAEGAYFASWLKQGLNPFQAHVRGPVGPEIDRGVCGRQAGPGVNFGSQDYLALNQHPALKAAAIEAVENHGLHSGGAASLAGICDTSIELERELARFVGHADATLFPIGWAAGFGLITSLVKPTDHVILDFLAHACLQQGAMSATPNVHRVPHLSVQGVERRLKRLRASDAKAGILVVTETLFSMDSDVPDIAALQALCHEYGATLFVDAAHDLGAIGEDGLGFLAAQDMIGKVDIMMGAFSKCFAGNGGFVACNEKALKVRLRIGCGPSTFTNAISPVQVAVARAALGIIRSPEGAARRKRLMENTLYVRERFRKEGFTVLGEPSAIVPVVLGDQLTSRFMTKIALDNGVFVNLAEYPAVPRNASRWRLQIMADHERIHLDRVADVAVQARAMAQAMDPGLKAVIPA